MKKVAVLLSGCGVFDGSEIVESVMTLYHIELQGASYRCMAPNIEQLHVINHLTGEVVAGQRRNVLEEAARLARGDIMDLRQADPDDYDALIIPGGFGAAKNLSDFAVAGERCEVQQDVLNFAQAMHRASKPVGLICIAPVMVPIIFGDQALCTIGNDADTASKIEAMGGRHQNCPVHEVVIDGARKLVTTPAYMLAGSIAEATSGISRLVETVLAMS